MEGIRKVAMIDDKGNEVEIAPPSTPANVLGWSGVPDSGSVAAVVRTRGRPEEMEEAEDLEKKQTQFLRILNWLRMKVRMNQGLLPLMLGLQQSKSNQQSLDSKGRCTNC